MLRVRILHERGAVLYPSADAPHVRSCLLVGAWTPHRTDNLTGLVHEEVQLLDGGVLGIAGVGEVSLDSRLAYVILQVVCREGCHEEGCKVDQSENAPYLRRHR